MRTRLASLQHLTRASIHLGLAPATISYDISAAPNSLGVGDLTSRLPDCKHSFISFRRNSCPYVVRSSHSEHSLCLSTQKLHTPSLYFESRLMLNRMFL